MRSGAAWEMNPLVCPGAAAALTITVLVVDTSVTCDGCGWPHAVTIVYLLHLPDRPAGGVDVLTYCPTCGT